MIDWTIQGTVPRLTGVTVVEGSSSSESTYNLSGSVEGQTDSATGSGLTTYTYFSQTSVGISGGTTSSSSSTSEAYVAGGTINNSGLEYNTDNVLETTTAISTNSDFSSYSTSSSFSTASDNTAQIQTSTTETFEQIYEVTAVITEGGPFNSIWRTATNTYGSDQTSVSFFQTTGSQTTSIGISYATRTETVDATTYLEETITLTALPDTVIQANTRRADLAEIIYVLTQTISDVASFSAATASAISSTRLTISPRLRTEAKIAAHST